MLVPIYMPYLFPSYLPFSFSLSLSLLPSICLSLSLGSSIFVIVSLSFVFSPHIAVFIEYSNFGAYSILVVANHIVSSFNVGLYIVGLRTLSASLGGSQMLSFPPF